MNKSRIVCAANRFQIKIGVREEYVTLIGPRHWDEVMYQQFENLDSAIQESFDVGSEEQGFIDQFGKFYIRQDAFIIAKENGQIIRDLGLGYPEDELYSEHLY